MTVVTQAAERSRSSCDVGCGASNGNWLCDDVRHCPPTRRGSGCPHLAAADGRTTTGGGFFALKWLPAAPKQALLAWRYRSAPLPPRCSQSGGSAGSDRALRAPRLCRQQHGARSPTAPPPRSRGIQPGPRRPSHSRCSRGDTSAAAGRRRFPVVGDIDSKVR
jgi:hypothetical protein